jgi:hypothetical protein
VVDNGTECACLGVGGPGSQQELPYTILVRYAVRITETPNRLFTYYSGKAVHRLRMLFVAAAQLGAWVNRKDCVINVGRAGGVIRCSNVNSHVFVPSCESLYHGRRRTSSSVSILAFGAPATSAYWTDRAVRGTTLTAITICGIAMQRDAAVEARVLLQPRSIESAAVTRLVHSPASVSVQASH